MNACFVGAGEGSRTLATALEGQGSTTELHPRNMVVGEGFEPSKAPPTDLQSVPFDHSGTPPNMELVKGLEPPTC